MRLPRAGAVLRQRTFRWFFLARTVNALGTALTAVALAFAVLSIGDAGDLGLVMAAHAVSMIVFILLGGVVADRLPRHGVIRVTWTVAGLCQAAAATLLLTDTASVPALAGIEAVAGAAAAFTMPAMQGLIPQVTDRRYLQEADSLMAFVRATLNLGGPVLSGLLVAGPGPAWALLVDAASFFLAVACFTQVHLPAVPMRRATMLQDLRTGWGEFTRRSWVWSVVLAFGLSNAVFEGAFLVIGPSVAEATPGLGPRGWGIALSGSAAGVLVTTVALLRVRLTRPLVAGLLACTTDVAPLLALALHPTIPTLMLATALTGIGFQVFGTAWNVSLQENVPTESLSRVSSYDMLGSFVLGPLGLAFYGWAASHADVRQLLLVSAGALLVLHLAPLLVPGVRGMRRAAPAGHETGIPLQ